VRTDASRLLSKSCWHFYLLILTTETLRIKKLRARVIAKAKEDEHMDLQTTCFLAGANSVVGSA
jgi:hypothetical protein